MADVGGQVYRFFRQQAHLSPAAAAGIVGNTQQESSNNPNAPGGGLIQGQGGRTSSGTLQQQLNGILAELNGPERATLQALRGVSDPRAAARIFSERFERPSDPRLGNRERYAAEALARYGAGGGAGGSAAAPGAPGEGRVQPGQSAAQSADLLSLIGQLQGSQAAPTNVEGIALPKPTEPASQAPHVPRELPSSSASVSPAALLSLISQIGADGEPARSTQAGGAGAAAAPAGGGGYVNPLPGFSKGRTDQGVDYSATPGAPIKAIGNARVLATSPNWYKGQPYVSYELLDGPRKGQVIYTAEQISPTVKAGDRVRAGQAIGRYASSGTGIEIGLGTRTPGQTLAKSTSGYSEGQETPAGKQARRLLEHLGAR